MKNIKEKLGSYFVDERMLIYPKLEDKKRFGLWMISGGIVPKSGDKTGLLIFALINCLEYVAKLSLLLFILAFFFSPLIRYAPEPQRPILFKNIVMCFMVIVPGIVIGHNIIRLVYNVRYGLKLYVGLDLIQFTILIAISYYLFPNSFCRIIIITISSIGISYLFIRFINPIRRPH